MNSTEITGAYARWAACAGDATKRRVKAGQPPADSVSIAGALIPV